MTYYSISIHSYSGGKQPKSFSGSDKNKVIEAYRDYVTSDEREEVFCNDCYLKVSQNDIIVTSHERDPKAALQDCCSKLYNGRSEPKPGNMIVVDSDREVVEEDGDDIEKEPESDFAELDREDEDELSNDMKVDGEAVDKDWDIFLED